MSQFPMPQPGVPPGGGGGFGFNWSGGMGDMFNALLNNYNKAASYQVEDLSYMPSRNRIAFQEHQRRNELRDLQADQDRTIQADSYATAKSSNEKALLLAEREKLAAKAIEDNKRRAGLNAIMGRYSGYSAVPGSTGNTGALADYYEYGAGNPQGRGGGGNATQQKVGDNGYVGNPLEEYQTPAWGPRR